MIWIDKINKILCGIVCCMMVCGCTVVSATVLDDDNVDVQATIDWSELDAYAIGLIRDAGYLDNTSTIYGKHDTTTDTYCMDYLVSRQISCVNKVVGDVTYSQYATYYLYVINSDYLYSPDITYLTYAKPNYHYEKWSGGGVDVTVGLTDGTYTVLNDVHTWSVGDAHYVYLDNIVALSCDLVDTEGTVFFQQLLPPAPAEEVLVAMVMQMTTTAGQSLMASLADWLITLLPLGIGLLICWIGVVTLRKVLRIFLR